MLGFRGHSNTFLQVKDILTLSQEFHRQLRERIADATAGSPDPRLQMLSQHLERRESALADALQRYASSSRLMEIWIKTVPDIDVFGPLNDLSDESDAEGLAQALSQVNENLRTFYLRIADLVRGSSEQVADLFVNLAQLEEEANKRSVEDALGVEEI